MYVCVCKAVSHKHIHRAVNEGAVSLRDLKNLTGLGTCCGKCVPDARRTLTEATARRAAAEQPLFSAPGLIAA
ncbi:(2Fe-2S)-binding protein [Stagnimonas aquatica]|uniref:Bacterioferritin-associated ferredoxin n=1 Tax=Stagnimonas aquatica TaxID=2689987 RepID=A0A3N0VKT0_9GAMM|nr:(2Fe-2S)-binding protein [Stagnimonas aquatica]ROH93373.1 (2Fe-2S)-binding protein [Stagnimonas aquatica]